MWLIRIGAPSEKLNKAFLFQNIMSYPDQEGPIIGIRQATTYKSCSGCKYHEHRLWRSGRDPEYIDICIHETAPKNKYSHLLISNLETEDGNVIPGEWCPFEPVNKNPYF